MTILGMVKAVTLGDGLDDEGVSSNVGGFGFGPTRRVMTILTILTMATWISLLYRLQGS